MSNQRQTTNYSPDRLNQTIERIKSKEIQEKAKNVRDKLLALYNENEENGNKIAMLLSLTHKLLTSKPGDQRNNLIKRYQKEANKVQGKPSALWKALGLSMIILGACISSIGLFTILPGFGVGIGVATVLTGFGFFNLGSNYRTNLSKDMYSLQHLITKNNEILIEHKLNR